MKFYVDADFCCHTENTFGTCREMESDFFDGKCKTFIEGYRYVPSGESWIRSDGKTFHGEMISPCKDFVELDRAQREYEKQLIATYEKSLKTLGVVL